MHSQNLVHLSSLTASADSSGGGIFAFLMLILLGILVIVLLIVVSKWITYKKAGQPGWAVIVPVYNTVKMLEITGKPLWWILPILFVPILNLVLMILVIRRFAAVFGKGVGFTWGLIFLPFIFYPILAFGSATYTAPTEPPRPMSHAVKWTLIGGCALVIFYFLWLLVAGSSRPAEPFPVRDHNAGFDGTMMTTGSASDTVQ